MILVNDPDFTLHVGDALETLRTMPAESVDMCVTSPPYWGLRDYSTNGQLGLEATPDLYVQNMVAVFREVRRVLKPHGSCWVNLGSSYAGAALPDARRNGTPYTEPQGSPGLDSACRDLCDEHLADYLSHIAGTRPPLSPDALPLEPTDRDSGPAGSASTSQAASPPDVRESTTLESWLRLRGSCSRCDERAVSLSGVHSSADDVPASSHMSWLNYTNRLKQKDMVPTPWMVAMALQEDGWYLRSDIIWSKPNVMPESVTDRPTKSHEYVFLLSKSPRYFFDQEAVREQFEARPQQRLTKVHDQPLAAARRAAGVEQGNPQGGAHVSRFAIQEETLGSECGCAEAGCGRAFHESDCGCACHHLRSLRSGGVVELPAADRSVLGVREDDRQVGRNVRSVWEIATHPFPEAHFATFPPALVRRCILAGSSERGVCSVCGKPWERILESRSIERNELPRDDPNYRPSAAYDGDWSRGAHNGSNKGQRFHESTTTGWRPTCDHDREPVPATVLDPFLGSGTTALVAREQGRRCVGIELSPEYAGMAARRLGQLSLLAEPVLQTTEGKGSSDEQSALESSP